jgi:hypothetical protein
MWLSSMREDGSLLHALTGMVVALQVQRAFAGRILKFVPPLLPPLAQFWHFHHLDVQAPPLSGVQLILYPALESPPEFGAKFSHDASGCLLHYSSGLFVHPKTGKGKEGEAFHRRNFSQPPHPLTLTILSPLLPGIPLMLHTDPPSRAYPGEIQFSFIPVPPTVAAGRTSIAALSPSVPMSPALVEWNVPVYASLAGDDNIEGDTYEVGRVYVARMRQMMVMMVMMMMMMATALAVNVPSHHQLSSSSATPSPLPGSPSKTPSTPLPYGPPP